MVHSTLSGTILTKSCNFASHYSISYKNIWITPVSVHLVTLLNLTGRSLPLPPLSQACASGCPQISFNIGSWTAIRAAFFGTPLIRTLSDKHKVVKYMINNVNYWSNSRLSIDKAYSGSSFFSLPTLFGQSNALGALITSDKRFFWISQEILWFKNKIFIQKKHLFDAQIIAYLHNLFFSGTYWFKIGDIMP